MSESMKRLEALLGERSPVLANIRLIGTALKRKQLCGSHPCAKATLEIINIALTTDENLQTAESMVAFVRLLGAEFGQCAPSELTVGNIARRVMQIIREEYAHNMPGSFADKISGEYSGGRLRERAPSVVEQLLAGGKTPAEEDGEEWAAQKSVVGVGASYRGAKNDSSRSSGTSKEIMASSQGGGGGGGGGANGSGGGGTYMQHQQPSLGSILGAWQPSLADAAALPTALPEELAAMREAVVGAVQELSDEIDNVYGPICEQAQEHIHAEECILTYGWSLVVDAFLKAAGRTRKYHVIVAEAAPELNGHKLAASLSKGEAGNNVTVTLVPDSAVFAIMGRVNKVVMAPHAVLADGGGTYSAGHLMVAVAAKQHNVPVIGLAATFTLTPMFAHNQTETLGLLLSPSLTIPYNANICQENVEVVNPAFDLIPPELMSLYVTNNGCHQPSYVHRLLAELYHPSDHGSLM